MGTMRGESKKETSWNLAGRMAVHLLIGWVAANVVFLFITPGVWTDLDYVRQIPLIPFLLVTAVGAFASWLLEKKKGEAPYRAKKKALVLIAFYVLAAAALAVADALGVEGIL